MFRINTFKSAFKAFSFNKFSDVFLFLAVILFFNLMHSFDILTIKSQLFFFRSVYLDFFFFKLPVLDLLSFFLLICAFVKSAQIGPHI